MIVHFNYLLFPLSGSLLLPKNKRVCPPLFPTHSLQQGGYGKISFLNKKSIGNIHSGLKIVYSCSAEVNLLKGIG